LRHKGAASLSLLPLWEKVDRKAPDEVFSPHGTSVLARDIPLTRLE